LVTQAATSRLYDGRMDPASCRRQSVHHRRHRGDATPSRCRNDPLIPARRLIARFGKRRRRARRPGSPVAFTAPQLAASEGFVTADISGLGPDRTYRYAFVSADGNTRKAPLAASRHRAERRLAPSVAGTSCTARDAFVPGHWRRRARHRGRVLRAQRRSGFRRTPVRRARRSARSYAETYGPKRHCRSAPRLHLVRDLDDHEFDQNFNPETFPRSASTRRSAATGAQPGAPQPDGRKPYLAHVSLGQDRRAVHLDCRTERRAVYARHGPTRPISPREQMDWLKAGLGGAESRSAYHGARFE